MDRISTPSSRSAYVLGAPQAMRLIRHLITQLNSHYGYRIGRVSIRNQKSRWGSCGKEGNLSFNWKLVLIPPEIAEYIVAHEICHIGSFDHSKKFWNLVAETIPDWRARRAALKKFRL